MVVGVCHDVSRGGCGRRGWIRVGDGEVGIGRSARVLARAEVEVVVAYIGS